MVWICRACTAAYAVEAPRCPQCGTNDPIDEVEQLELEKERDNMPKITRHEGPTFETPEGAESSTNDLANLVAPADGSAPYTEDDEGVRHYDQPALEDDGSAPAVAPVGDDQPGNDVDGEQQSAEDNRDLYEAQTAEDLKDELRERKLAVSGSKPELVDRLIEHDRAQHEQAGDAEQAGQ